MKNAMEIMLKISKMEKPQIIIIDEVTNEKICNPTKYEIERAIIKIRQNKIRKIERNKK